MRVVVRWKDQDEQSFENIEAVKVIPNAVVLENVNGAMVALIPFSQGGLVIPEHDTKLVQASKLQ